MEKLIEHKKKRIFNKYNKKNEMSSHKEKTTHNPIKRILFLNNIKTKNKILFNLLIFIYLIILISTFDNQGIVLKYSSITLKVEKSGNIKIFNTKTICSYYPPIPDQVYINGEKKEFQSYYNFPGTNNNITLIWNNSIDKSLCMFDECSDITEINVSNFDSSKVKNMGAMFRKCSSLKSLDLSNLITSQNPLDDNNIFEGCSSLEYLKLDNVVLNNALYSLISKINSSKLIVCSNDKTIKQYFQYQNIICKKNLSQINDGEQICYSKYSNNIYNCSKCGNNYYKIYNNPDYNCYQLPEGYYLDLENSICKLCYSTCKKCEKEGNETYHNCIECNDNYKYELKLNIKNYLNCYNICDNYYYIDLITNKTYCTQSLNCPEDYNKLIIEKNECIDDCSRDSLYKFEYKGICYDKEFQSELIKSTEIYNSISSFEEIKEYILKNANRTDILNGNDLEEKKENLLITLTTPKNQMINLDKNKTTINLGECENKIKKYYNVSMNDTLFIFKIDKKEEGMKIPKIEYEIYYPLYTDELIKLNLTECKNTNIDISIPVSINDSLDKYNANSDYYQDICIKATSNKGAGVDISLSDRKSEFVNNNMTLCEEDCELKEYNKTSERAKCSCLIKINLRLIDEIKFDKNKLYSNFVDIKNIVNTKLMKCYRNVLNRESLKNNYGFFISILIIFIFYLTLILFYSKYYAYHKELIKKIFKAKIEVLESEKNIENNIINIQKRKGKKIKNKKKKNNDNLFPPIKSKRKRTKKNNNNNDTQLTLNKKKEYEKIFELNDKELNLLIYKSEILFDKRTFTQYYFSLLRTGHLFIFSFYCNKKDYNVQIIKIFLFFFFFDVHFVVNALFFNDNTMHQIYEDEGSFNFIYQIPQIIYSSLISGIIIFIWNKRKY